MSWVEAPARFAVSSSEPVLTCYRPPTYLTATIISRTKNRSRAIFERLDIVLGLDNGNKFRTEADILASVFANHKWSKFRWQKYLALSLSMPMSVSRFVGHDSHTKHSVTVVIV